MIFLSLLTLASLPALSFAAKTVTACVQTCGSLSTRCSTEYATNSVAVISTVTSTNVVPTTVTISATETTYLLTTVTPSPVTTTTTLTTTTVTTTILADVSSTIIVTDTSTETDTATITTTSTETDTSTTSTTVTTTSTVAPSAGFQPVSDTVNGFPTKKNKRNLAQQGLSHGLSAGNSTRDIMQGMHPNHVNCEVVSIVSETRILWATANVNSTTTMTQVATSTEVDPTYTTLPPVDVTATVTSTVTSTSTQGPATDLITTTTSTTTTVTITSTATATTTSTTTTTMTFTTTATYQAACATNNIIGPVYTNDGDTRTIVNFYNNGPGSATSFTIVTADSSSDCCEACFNTAGCTASLYSSGQCLIIPYGSQGTGQCVQSQNPDFWTYDEGSDSGGYVVSNGPCGYAYDGGTD